MELEHLKKAYTAQNRRIDGLNERLALLEDQLEAQQTARTRAPVAQSPMVASAGPSTSMAPSHLPVVPLTPGQGAVAPVVTRTRFLTQKDLDALDAEVSAAPAPKPSARRGRAAKARDEAASARRRRAERRPKGGQKAEVGRRPDEGPARVVEGRAKRGSGEGASAREADVAPKAAKGRKRSVAVRTVPVRPVDAAPGDNGPVGQYRAAYAAYQVSDFERAAVGFREYLQRWPNHDYAEGAMFWLGHCAARRGQHQKAVQTFRKMINRFPTGDHIPEALLEVGLAQDKLGRKNEARETLSRLVEMYPRTDAARRATAWLEGTRSGM